MTSKVKIQAKLNYRYTSGKDYYYVISVYGGQKLTLNDKDLRDFARVANIEGLQIKDGIISVDKKKKTYSTVPMENKKEIFVQDLIEGLVIEDTIEISAMNSIKSGEILDTNNLNFIKEVLSPMDSIKIKDNIAIRSDIVNSSLFCNKLSMFFTSGLIDIINQQQYTTLATDFLAKIQSKFLQGLYFSQDKNLLYQLYLLHDYHTYTFEHSCSVALYSTMVGMHMGLSDEECEDLFLGGLLHDIGKRKIPIEILDKEGKLTTEEFDLMMTHAFIGYTMISNLVGFDSPIFKNYKDVNRMQQITQTVMGHHAKLDGTGYPKGFLGEYITTQIVTVCDMFDAITSVRSYKKPLSNSKAIKILTKEAKNGKLNKDVVNSLSVLLDLTFTKSDSEYICLKHGISKPFEHYMKDLYTI